MKHIYMIMIQNHIANQSSSTITKSDVSALHQSSQER
uniref:Predicted protein n=1 Tax=Hordeum vulgare subsp. vulgare TaxID=112509 RepID=F2E2X0_HORVV|nr:predicted protein [Hordeum vulgare subsp. vulgare]